MTAMWRDFNLTNYKIVFTQFEIRRRRRRRRRREKMRIGIKGTNKDKER
jgi:hypothetical protein